MAFLVTAPDGNQYRVNAPDDATEEQIRQYVTENYLQSDPRLGHADWEDTSVPFEQSQNPGPNSIAQGMVDPLNAGAQMLNKALPQGAVDAINTFNDYLVDKGAPFPRMGEDGLESQLRAGEEEYQQARAAAGDAGADYGRLTGNMVSPANLAIASRIPQPAGLGGKVASNALGGAAMGAMASPSFNDDYSTEILRRSLFGAAAGAATSLAARGASRAVAPQVDANRQLLMEEGVRLTPGQRMGGAAQRQEDISTSQPFVGYTVQEGRQRGYDDFNRAAYNRSLGPIGQELPTDVPIGHRAAAYTRNAISNEYDRVLAPMVADFADPVVVSEINNITRMATRLGENEFARYRTILQDDVLQHVEASGRASGATLKKIESVLTERADQFGKGSGYELDLSNALIELRASIMRMAERQNPDLAPQLRATNEAFANSLRPRRAAATIGSDEGVFTPAQLDNAVRALDSSKNKRAYGENTALMQDLSNAGKAVLPSKYPDSGTAGRMKSNELHSNIIGAAAWPVMGAPQTELGSDLMRRIMTPNRPGAAAPIARGVDAAAPYGIPPVFSGLQGLLGM